MKKTLWIAMSVVALAGFCWLVQAGDLEPPGPPAPTMVTLQDIYEKLDGLVPGAVGVPKTGLTGCWGALGIPIACAGTGQDGEHQAGVSVDPRFTDNGDGTVRDNLTGLIWLKNANCFGIRNWTLALSDANNLADGSCGLTDGSASGDWRMPNVKELQSLFDYSQDGPALTAGHPFTGVQLSFYWSSTTVAAFLNSAWDVSLINGFVGNNNKTAASYVWPVRGGQ
jgi:hypothetical protein